MKPISEVRRERLRELVDQAGSQVAVADKLGKNKNQVHQWLLDPETPGARNIGPRSARLIERAFGRPDGWLDTDASYSETYPSRNRDNRQSLSARLDVLILTEALKVLSIDEEVGGIYKPDNRANALVTIYDQLAAGVDPMVLIARITQARSQGEHGGDEVRKSGSGAN